jgi:membrane protease YdiL (CAAX protease family)
MTASPIRSNAELPIGDVAAGAAVLAVFFIHTATERAVIDTPVEHVIYEAVAAIAMLAVAYRTRIGCLGLPATPKRLRSSLAFVQARRSIEVFCLTSVTIALAVVVRGSSERAAALIWPPSVADGNGVVDSGCRSYNDPACSGDSVTVDIIEVFTASVGEEFAYRFALFVIIARFTSVRFAIVAQAAIWALSHTGYEGGYEAAAVVGLFCVGLVYAISVLGTGSIWPAILAHALHNLGVAAFDHDLNVVAWFVVATTGLSAIVLAAAVSIPVARYIARRR